MSREPTDAKNDVTEEKGLLIKYSQVAELFDSMGFRCVYDDNEEAHYLYAKKLANLPDGESRDIEVMIAINKIHNTFSLCSFANDGGDSYDDHNIELDTEFNIVDNFAGKHYVYTYSDLVEHGIKSVIADVMNKARQILDKQITNKE